MKKKGVVYFKISVCFLCIVLTVIIDCLDEIFIRNCRHALKLTRERLNTEIISDSNEHKIVREMIMY